MQMTVAQDFFYTCAGHLSDKGFASPIIDAEAVAAKQKEEAKKREIERVVQEYEEKQRKKKEKRKAEDDAKDKEDEKDKKKAEADEDSKAEKERDEKVSLGMYRGFGLIQLANLHEDKIYRGRSNTINVD
jgi:archaellum component FlaD/FlaE